jgi:competence protein ComEA
VSRSDRILVAAGGAAVVLAAVAVVILLVPIAAPSPAPTTEPGVGLLVGTPSAEPPAASDQPPPSGGTIFVDVEGAVAEPGIRELPAGSRIADAIAAAGGYASDADLGAAATAINLAQPLGDGEQVQVPRIGETPPAPVPSTPAVAGGGGSGDGTAGGASTGLVNLNTATPEELEALPGIGAVTVQKIVAARQERPFASLQDAVDRGVIHRGQLEDIQGVATAG